MKRSRPFVALVTLVVAACSVAGAPPSQGAAGPQSISSPSATMESQTTLTASPQVSLVPCPSGGTPESPIMLTAEEALSCDLASAAEGRGTTVEEEYARHRAAEIVGEIAQRISQERPGIFVGGAVWDEPGGGPAIYIKGPADEFVRDLVRAAAIDIEIIDNQPYSSAELDARQNRASQALLALGFKDFSAHADIRTGRIQAAVTIEEGLPADPTEVIALLPADLRDSVDLTMSDTPGVDTIPE